MIPILQTKKPTKVQVICSRSNSCLGSANSKWNKVRYICTQS